MKNNIDNTMVFFGGLWNSTNGLLWWSMKLNNTAPKKSTGGRGGMMMSLQYAVAALRHSVIIV